MRRGSGCDAAMSRTCVCWRASRAQRPRDTDRRSGGGVGSPVLGSARSRTRCRPTRTALAAPVPAMTVHDATGDASSAQGDLTGAGMLQNSLGTGVRRDPEVGGRPEHRCHVDARQCAESWQVDSTRRTTSRTLPQCVATDTGPATWSPTSSIPPSTFAARPPSPSSSTWATASPPPRAACPTLDVRFGAAVLHDVQPLTRRRPSTVLPTSTSPRRCSFRPRPRATATGCSAPDGHVYPFGGAIGFPGAVPIAAGMAPRKDGKGYWVVDRAGHVFTYGTARYFGGAPRSGAGELVSTISATPNGGRYWLFTNRGARSRSGMRIDSATWRGLRSTVRSSRRSRPRRVTAITWSVPTAASSASATRLPRLDRWRPPEPAGRRHRADARQPGLLARCLRRRRVRVQRRRSADRWVVHS